MENENKTVKTQNESDAAVSDEEIKEEAKADASHDHDHEHEKGKKCKKLEAEIEKLKKELDDEKKASEESNKKYLTMLAEYDNFRRRSAKEKESAYSDAYIDVLEKILPVLDNLERAAAYKDGESVLHGLELTLKSFNEVLSKLGIKEIDAVGGKFDPNLHNAVMHVEDDEHGEGEVVEVLQKGYMCGDKVLRYAMVKVAN